MRTILILALLISNVAYAACPKINGMRDRNCDGKIKIVIIGDSIVYGWGISIHSGEYRNYSDYVRDATGAEVIGFGIPGITARGLSDAITGRGDFYGADYGIVDVGRNGVYAGDSVGTTALDIRRLTLKLKSMMGEDSFATASTLLKSLRPEVQDFNTPLNKKLIDMRTDNFNVVMRFNTIDTAVICGDNLHLTFEGMEVVGNRVISTLRGL